MSLRENMLARIVANSEPHVTAGETVRMAIQGQAGMRPKVVAVTDETVYLLRGSVWSNVGVKAVETALPRGTTVAAMGLYAGRIHLRLLGLQMVVNVGDHDDVSRLVQAINEPGSVP